MNSFKASGSLNKIRYRKTTRIFTFMLLSLGISLGIALTEAGYNLILSLMLTVLIESVIVAIPTFIVRGL